MKSFNFRAILFLLVLGMLHASFGQTSGGKPIKFLWTSRHSPVVYPKPSNLADTSTYSKTDTTRNSWLAEYVPSGTKNGAAVIAIPGGGYSTLSPWSSEAVPAATNLNSYGVTVFILHYRITPYGYPHQMWDVQRAVRWVRANAAAYGIDTLKRTVPIWKREEWSGGSSWGLEAQHIDDLDRFDRRSTHLAQQLYDEALQCRMRPFGDATHAYPRVVRDLARSLAKRVRFAIVGEATQVDRDILDMLDAPLAQVDGMGIPLGRPLLVQRLKGHGGAGRDLAGPAERLVEGLEFLAAVLEDAQGVLADEPEEPQVALEGGVIAEKGLGAGVAQHRECLADAQRRRHQWNLLSLQLLQLLRIQVELVELLHRSAFVSLK